MEFSIKNEDISPPRQKSASGTYPLSEWLNINCLATETISIGLQIAEKYLLNTPFTLRAAVDKEVCLDAESAWNLAAEALGSYFPSASALIENVRVDTKTSFKPDLQGSPLPYTRAQGFGKPPYVRCPYNGMASDLINVSHEFAHAVQLVASQSSTMPPVAREVCAFIGEQALLSKLSKDQPALHESIVNVWHAENHYYLGKCGQMLRTAINNPSIPYHYRWNYPIARVIAYLLFRTTASEELWQFFRNIPSSKLSINKILNDNLENTLKNKLPPFLKLEEDETAAVNIYRLLGSMLLLDLNHREKNRPQKQIEEYYGGLVQAIRNQTFAIALNYEKKPLGYVTWRIASNDESAIRVCQLSAPFGDELKLEKLLKKRLPKGTHIDLQMKNRIGGGLRKR